MLLAGELQVLGLDAVAAEGLSVVITLVLRLIWTIAEVIVAVLLYRFIPADKRPILMPAAEVAG